MKCPIPNCKGTIETDERTEDLVEILAELEHEQWAHWISYEHSLRKGMVNYVYAQKWKDWLSQAKTPYSKLSEKEKESDRKWARKVLEVLRECGVRGEAK